ncbi:MAG TPA: hypothetical protein VGO75_10540 [Gemmatimonadaceae bacterium]|jgi:hypothetical protein|nr:hypothetical protein [Gemmatimonadaceae bacterium]
MSLLRLFRPLARSSAAIVAGGFFALALLAKPVSAQLTLFSVAGGTITFPAPTAADYIAGFVNSTTGVTFTTNAVTGGSRTTTVAIRAISTTLGGTKAIGDLQWRRSDLAGWTPITTTNAQVEQRVQVLNGANDPWSNTVFFRMILNWATDPPATYSATYQVTLTQTVP